MKNNKLNLPSELVTTACLAGSLSIILSLTSITYCILGLLYRYECSVGVLTNRNGAEYFLATLLQTYILNEECSAAKNVYNITKADSVFILAIIISVFAAVNFITAITLISAAKLEEASKNVDIVAYIHIGVSLACLVVDLTLGVHFGMDYTYLTNYLALNAPGLETNYEIDSIRIGAFLLMTLSLKGYIGHAINLILLVLLICHVVQYQNVLQENEHAIHTLGVLSAFDPSRRFVELRNSQRNDVFPAYSRGLSSNHVHDEVPHFHNQMREHSLSFEHSNTPKRSDDPWQMNRNDSMFSGYPRRPQGPQVNPAYEEEPSRPSTKENSFHDHNNRHTKRTDSWLHNQISSGPGLGSRPFSYLEEPKRPVPVKPPTMPSNEPQWRRDAWPPAPPVPDPDYSPPPRRLKSVLKSNYP